MKKILANLSLSLISLFVFFLLLEFVVFRFIFPASDIAIPDYIDGVVRYQSGQTGIYRVKNEIESEFKVNTNGWNSKYKTYDLKKDPNKYRVAIIGDSYIAAYQIDYRKSVAEQLESKLGDKNVEVYRFGIDGAPLSQYLHMLRKEVIKYNPDLVIVNVVHNDFEESYSFVPGVFRSSFLKYEIADGKVSEEILPVQYQPPWYSWIREKSATWKYLAYRQQVHFGVLRDLILGTDENIEYQANIDVSNIEVNTQKNILITDYTFSKMKQICDSKGIELIIVMNADDDLMYEEDKAKVKSRNNSTLLLNQIATDSARKHDIRFIDLQGLLEKEYATHKKRLSFYNDGHWNEYTHGLVSDILATTIKTSGFVN